MGIHTLRSNSNLKMLVFQEKHPEQGENQQHTRLELNPCHIAGRLGGGGGEAGSALFTTPSLLTVNHISVLVHVSSVLPCQTFLVLHVHVYTYM